MGIVNGSLELGYKNTAWFTANPTLVLKEGQIVYLEQTGTYKIGNGVSTLSALSFLGVSSETQTLQNVTDLGSTTTNSITANSFIKSGGTASQFLKANGSVDSTTYLSTQVVPVGGTTGQILAKVDDTDYNLEWIENYANYTSVLKHTVRAGETLVKGQAVYVSGANGTNIIVSKASNTTEATSSKTMGLIAQNLSTNNNGFVITEGLLDNLNTSTATIGDPVWLGVNGALIYGLVNKPYAPAHLVFIGIVTRVSATVGEIFVKVQNGFELKEIHDVDLITTAPSNNEILTFESSTSLWKPKTVVSALGFTPYNSTNPSGYISGITSGMVTTALGFTPYNSTNPSGYITGITSGMVTTALGFTPYDATNPDGYITSSALSPYALIANPTFTTAITTPILYGSSVSGGNLVISSTSNATKGSITIGNANSDTVYLGNQQFGFTSVVFYTASSATGFSLSRVTATDTTPIFVINRSDGTTGIGGVLNKISLIANGLTRFSVNGVTTSGATTSFSLTKPDNTNQTLSTSIAGWNYNGGTRQWATGNITTQSENVWGATTYSFVGASTITNAYGNVFNAPIAGTNATITNNYAAQFNGNLQINGIIDRVAINYPSLSPIYKLGVGGSMVVNGQIIVQDDSGVFAAYSSDGLTQSGGFNFNRYVGVNIYSSNTNPIKLSVNGSENFRMFNGGNILIQNGGTFTNNGFRLDVNGTGRFQNTLTLATGTTTIAPLKLTAGTNLTTPVNGSFEFDGTNLYFTVGGVRKMVTLI